MNRHQLALSDYFPNSVFDVVTARMVVEHVGHPREFATDLYRVTGPGSLVVLFTVNWWSITTLAAHLIPNVDASSCKGLFVEVQGAGHI